MPEDTLENFPLKPLDLGLKWVTFFCVVAACSTVLGAFFAPVLDTPFLLLLSLGLAVWGWFRPRRLEAGPEGIHVLWPWRRRWILRGQIVGMRIADLNEFKPMLRVGVGGLGGIFGWFWRPGKGWIEVYSTSRCGLLVLELEGGRNLLLSPLDPKAMMSALAIDPAICA